MEHNKCLNCGAEVAGKYCHNCGQSTSTHRITMKHFITHDLIHGIWHFDKGLLFTAREAIRRPGTMAMNYIKGKRIGYYNIFYLLLIVLGTNVLITHLFYEYNNIEVSGQHVEQAGAGNTDISGFIQHNLKLLLFLVIPFFAMNSQLIFRKLKLNFPEHAILSGTVLLSGAIRYTLYLLFIYLTFRLDSVFLDVIEYTLMGFILIAPIAVYYRAARPLYSIAGISWRMLVWYMLFTAELLVVVLIIMFYTRTTHITYIN